MHHQNRVKEFIDVVELIFELTDQRINQNRDHTDTDLDWVLIKMAEFSEETLFQSQTCILFSLFNYLIRFDPHTAMRSNNKSFEALQKDPEQKRAKICSMMVQSALLTSMEKHKQSLNVLEQVLKISAKSQNDEDAENKQFKKFYEIICARMISIFNIKVFRREYYQLIMRTLDKFGKDFQMSGISKALEARKKQIQARLCVTETKQKVAIQTNTISPTNSRFTLKSRNQISKLEKQNSQSSLFKKGTFSPTVKLKKDFKKQPIKIMNPYFTKVQKVDMCVFM